MPKFSGVPLKPGPPNPFYGKARHLVDQASVIREMEEHVRKVAMSLEDPSDFQALITKLDNDGTYKQYQDFLEGVEEAEAPVQIIGPPPMANDLYGRVADGTDIVDVGSGNCMRIKSHTGRLKITAVDPAIPQDPVIEKMVVDVVREEVGKEHIDGKIVTSFNAMVQLDSQILEEQDGIHVIPDHDYLLRHGQAVRDGDKIIVRASTGVFEDNYIDKPGLSLKDGYKLINTYARGGGVVRLEEKGVGDYMPHFKCSPANESNINWLDVGYKWDGLACEFEVVDGDCFVTYRDGSYNKGTTDLPNMCLQLEDMDDCFVLLRVVCYRGFVPAHSGDALRHFATRVRLKINGKYVYGPPPFGNQAPLINGVRKKVDGIITRNMEEDLYIKTEWTVDLRGEDIEKLSAHLSSQGIQVSVIGTKEHLSEYRVKKKHGIVTLTYSRDRDDKNEHTKLATIEYMLSAPTIHELTAMYGHMPAFEGLQNFVLNCA